MKLVEAGKTKMSLLRNHEVHSYISIVRALMCNGYRYGEAYSLEIESWMRVEEDKKPELGGLLIMLYRERIRLGLLPEGMAVKIGDKIHLRFSRSP